MRTESTDTPPLKMKPADYGRSSISQIANSNGAPLYDEVEIRWQRPELWLPGSTCVENAPENGAECLYIIMRDHENAQHRELIHYVGITGGARTRFYNHPTAQKLREMNGKTKISFGIPHFVKKRRKRNARPAIEEIEHILIWVLWPDYNEKKYCTLPGLGTKPGRAWHIKNIGHPFAGEMPLELVHPWTLVKWGRSVSKKW